MNDAVYSMTGFATETTKLPAGSTLTLDIRSVNSRFLDLSFKLPECFRHMESKLRELLATHIKRGKCEVRLSYQHTQTQTGAIRLSPEHIQQVLVQQSHIQALAPQAAALTVAEIIALTTSKADPDTELASEADVLALMRTVLASFMHARAQEGQQLAAVMLAQVSALQELRAQLAPLMPIITAQQRQRFVQRFDEALASSGGSITPSVAQERALTEATAFAIRIDVTEELDRLGSHLQEISNVLTRQHEPKNKMAAKQEMGKRLEFLIQELHREANTLGSKSAAMETTQIAIEMKILIEQLREQVQNLE